MEKFKFPKDWKPEKVRDWQYRMRACNEANQSTWTMVTKKDRERLLAQYHESMKPPTKEEINQLRE